MTALSKIAARLERDLPGFTGSIQLSRVRLNHRPGNVFTLTLFPNQQPDVDVVRLSLSVLAENDGGLQTYSKDGRNASIPAVYGTGPDGETVSLHLTPEQYDALAAAWVINLPFGV